MSRRHQKAPGFTLLEVLVAMTVLAIGIIGIVRAFSSCMTASRNTESYATASLLAAQTAAQLERTSPLEVGEYSGDFGEDAPDYTWQAVVSQADVEGMLAVDVTILWGPDEKPSRYQMQAFVREATEQTAQSDQTGQGGQP